MLFLVRSLNSKGQSTHDFFEAADYDILLQRLEQQQVIALSITNLPAFLAPILISANSKISQEEVIELMESMYLVIKSGLPLHQGILDLAEDSDNKRFKNMLLQIADDIHRGKSLAVSFEPYKSVVGVMILNLIRIGEETGQLQVTLQRGASFLRRITALKKKAKSALIYPSFAFFAVMGAMLVWMIYVLPQMTELFKEMDVELPPLTVAMMAISDFLSKYIGYMILSIFIILIIFKISHKKFKDVRWHTDRIVLKTPIIKEVVSSFNIAFISEYLRLALVSGVPLFSALETLKNNINNELFQKALIEASAEVEKGNQLSNAFKRTKLFTPFMLRMMSVGESSGSLDSQLELISEYYYEKVDYYAENIGKFIEPVVLIIVGGFMALVMVGLMGPMYDLISGIE
jgi:type II secretory pathway component PulF